MITTKNVFIYMFPGIMYFWLFFIGQSPMQEILNERERHTLGRMLAAPVSVLEFLLSKMIRCFLLCASTQALLLVVSTFLFGIRWGNPLLLGASVLACALSVTGFLAFIYSLVKTQEQAYSFSSGIIIVCALVGGSFFPFNSLPGFLKAVGWFSPNRWGILSIQTIAWSQPLDGLVKSLIILCAIGLVGSVTAFILLYRRLTGGGKR